MNLSWHVILHIVMLPGHQHVYANACSTLGARAQHKVPNKSWRWLIACLHAPHFFAAMHACHLQLKQLACLVRVQIWLLSLSIIAATQVPAPQPGIAIRRTGAHAATEVGTGLNILPARQNHMIPQRRPGSACHHLRGIAPEMAQLYSLGWSEEQTSAIPFLCNITEYQAISRYV